VEARAFEPSTLIMRSGRVQSPPTDMNASTQKLSWIRRPYGQPACAKMTALQQDRTERRHDGYAYLGHGFSIDACRVCRFGPEYPDPAACNVANAPAALPYSVTDGHGQLVIDIAEFPTQRQVDSMAGQIFSAGGLPGVLLTGSTLTTQGSQVRYRFGEIGLKVELGRNDNPCAGAIAPPRSAATLAPIPRLVRH